RQRGARADAGNLEQLAEGHAFVVRQKAEQQLRILAHDELSQQRHLVADIRQVVEAAHRHVDFVADAADIDEDLRGILFGEDAADTSDQGKPFKKSKRTTKGSQLHKDKTENRARKRLA